MSQMMPFTKEELRKVGGTFAGRSDIDLRDRAIWALGVCSRWRISEMLRLRRRDLLTQDGAVRRHIEMPSKFTKTRRASRLDIGDHLAGILRDWLAACERWGCWRRDDPAFPKVGARVAFDRKGAWRMVKRRCARAGVTTERHGTHSFKKTAVAVVYEHWLKEGADALRETQNWSGHASQMQVQAYLRDLPGGHYEISQSLAAANAEEL